MVKLFDLAATIRKMLRDSDSDQYQNEDIYNAIYMAELVVRYHQPDSTGRNIDYDTQAGARQDLSLVTDPIVGQVLSVHHNGTSADPGQAILLVDRSTLDQITPGWYSASKADESYEYSVSQEEPRVFYLNPPINASQKVNISVSVIPQKYDSPDSDTELSVHESFSPAVMEYALYVLLSEESEGGQGHAKSREHLANCSNLLGVKLQNQTRMSVKANES